MLDPTARARPGGQRRRAGRQENFRRGGTIVREAKLAGVLSLDDLGHQTTNRGHGSDAELLANSLVLLSRPEGAWKRVGRARGARRDPLLDARVAGAFPTCLDRKDACGVGLGTL